MKTKGFEDKIELLKKLQPYIKGNETVQYIIHNIGEPSVEVTYKTLTLEEAFELLPPVIHNAEWNGEDWSRGPCSIYFTMFKEIRNPDEGIIYKYQIKEFGTSDELDVIVGKTLLEVIENLLEYLINNDLLIRG